MRVRKRTFKDQEWRAEIFKDFQGLENALSKFKGFQDAYEPYIHTYIHTYILNWPLPIGAFQGQWNTTKRRNRTTTIVKNPNRPEANQLAIYKCSWQVEPGTTRIKFNEWSERVLNPGSPVFKASALTTGPHCLLKTCNNYYSHYIIRSPHPELLMSCLYSQWIALYFLEQQIEKWILLHQNSLRAFFLL